MARQILSSPYPICFHTLVASVLQVQAALDRESRVDFVFDEKSDGLRKCIGSYENWKKIATRLGPISLATVQLAGTIIPTNDRDVLPLQAADLLAGQFTSEIKAGEPEYLLKGLRARRPVMYTTVEENDVASYRKVLQAARLQN
jgi:hypothetical protein